jgi:ADP-ribose pyrophosphatase YjhB (NUDIX family)
MHHEYTYQFCPVCGAQLAMSNLKDHEPDRLVCSQCGFVFYLDPKLVACTIVEMEGRIILLKRDIAPQKGKWVVPGGYVDRGERVEVAAVREAKEECGIDVRIETLLGVYSYTGIVEAMIFYVAEYMNGTLTVGDEVSEFRLAGPREIPWEDLAFQSTRDALKDYYQLRDVKY